MTKNSTTKQAAFDFGIFSNEKKKTEQAYVSIDKQGRIYMNADAQKLFGIAKGVPSDLQIGYKDGAIYLIKVDSKFASPTAKPFRFSGDRAYASAKSLIESHGIMPTGDTKSEKYIYDESFQEFEGVFAFKHQKLMEVEASAESEVAATEEKPKAAPKTAPKTAAKAADKKEEATK